MNLDHAETNIAFKEWAAVCAALGAGRQTIILRKGGIQEGREGFRVRHRQFWLYPTHFHQVANGLKKGAAQSLEMQPPAGELHLRQLAVVEDVVELKSEIAAQALAGWHCWSAETINERFHYRQPGLFLLLARVFNRRQPHLVRETPEMAGCKSWVELPAPLAADELTPALPDAEFSAQAAEIRAALTGGG